MICWRHSNMLTHIILRIWQKYGLSRTEREISAAPYRSPQTGRRMCSLSFRVLQEIRRLPRKAWQMELSSSLTRL